MSERPDRPYGVGRARVPRPRTPRGARVPIARAPLRSEVRRLLLERLLKGEPAPGTGLNEADLAAELGVSRTPLREALLALEYEGFVRTDPGRGFSVQPLTAREADEIYPILWTLEGLALREVNVAKVRRGELERLNARLAEGKGDPYAALRLDRQWHDVLLEASPNRSLRETIAALKNRAFRYEYAYMCDSGRVITSVAQHAAIVTALDHGQADEAVRWLEANWRVSLQFLLPWLRTENA